MTVDAERHGLVGRRRFVRATLTGAVAVGAGLVSGAPATSTAATGLNGLRSATPESALGELAAGNRRWRTFHERHPDRTRAVRQALASGQHPFAVVLGCVDSRVPPELVFDQGLGDLLTVRSAGEVLDEAVLGSIAYGVLELAIPLVVVLGHQSCGAVTAAVQAAESGERLPGHMQYLADQVRPAIDRTLTGAARVDAAITENVRLVRSRLAVEPTLSPRIAGRRLAVVGARYELTSQRVHRIH
ncbi:MULTISPECIES: carbonic anhydrase [unclassified Streptomyces]|uniref:carbonic anhydrase n=1 Tax=unclassified Streptomyces TaxID=2593676 RepID=UPI00202E8158|nr:MULTISPECIES: carbonic anhydrase [unclassified Streptomyces]MCM1966033.1 carbonic anhydrase [Streptomyces sp. G1]MCX5126880.1 carbonic anhydrase [Streptomyces sp. NBC_00347]